MLIARPGGPSGGSTCSAPRSVSQGLPIKPWGRMTSTTAMTTNSTTRVSLDRPMPMHSALISPMRSAARKAPGRLPMPPTTTTTKASEIAVISSERCAEREHAVEKPLLIDAQRGDHVAVLRRRPDEPAPARAIQQQPQRSQHRRADRDQDKIVLGERRAEDEDRAAQPRRARAEQVLRSPEPQGEILEH